MDDTEDKDKVTEEFNNKKSEIIRDPIICFLIVKIKNNNDSFYINTVPITTDWNNFNKDSDLNSDDEIIGVVPAPQHSYMVSGLFPCNGVKYPDNGTFKPLGYEFEGAYRPDWNKELERRIKNGEIENNLEDNLGDNLVDGEDNPGGAINGDLRKLYWGIRR